MWTFLFFVLLATKAVSPCSYVHKRGRGRGGHCGWGLTLTRVAAVEEGGGAAAAGQEGQRRRHEPLHDPALPRAETQTAG